MGASDWWSRKLGNPASVTPPSRSPTATPSPPGPWATTPPPLTTYDANTGAQVQDDGFMSRIANAALTTGGTQKVKENSGKCPECGSGNFFARKYTENGMTLRIEAAPRCFDCGFPVIQAGSAHGGATAARNEGPAHSARQLPHGHQVTVQEGGRSYTFDRR